MTRLRWLLLGLLLFLPATTRGQEELFSNYIQMLGGNAGTAPALVARGTDTNINLVLTPQGTGTVTLNGGLTSALPVGSGGTGLTTLSANRVPFGNGTSAFQSSTAFTFGPSNVLSAGCSTCSASKITIYGSSTSNFGSLTSDSSGGVMLGDQTSNYLRVGGSLPTAGTCGTSPSVTASSTDTDGEITTGTGAFTTCVVNFSHTLSRTPFCVVSDDSTTSFLYISAKSSSSFTVSTTAAGLASVTIDWHCGGAV